MKTAARAGVVVLLAGAGVLAVWVGGSDDVVTPVAPTQVTTASTTATAPATTARTTTTTTTPPRPRQALLAFTGDLLGHLPLQSAAATYAAANPDIGNDVGPGSEEVDLVVGHHVHVVQPVDRLGDEYVVCGLGNFLSNQSANCCPVATQDGMIAFVGLLEGPDGRIRAIGVEYVPTWVDRDNGYVIRNALNLSERDGHDLTDILTASAARTAAVVESRLDDSDGFGVAYWAARSTVG